MPIDKFLQKKWYVTKLKIAALLDFQSHIRRNIARPTFCGVKANNAHGIPVPSVDEVLYGGLHIGVLRISLRKYATPFPEIVNDQIYRRFVFFGDEGGHWRLTHDQILLLWRKRPGFLCCSRRRCPVADDM
jgi:hypothetical protein